MIIDEIVPVISARKPLSDEPLADERNSAAPL